MGSIPLDVTNRKMPKTRKESEAKGETSVRFAATDVDAILIEKSGSEKTWKLEIHREKCIDYWSDKCICVNELPDIWLYR